MSVCSSSRLPSSGSCLISSATNVCFLDIFEGLPLPSVRGFSSPVPCNGAKRLLSYYLYLREKTDIIISNRVCNCHTWALYYFRFWVILRASVIKNVCINRSTYVLQLVLLLPFYHNIVTSYFRTFFVEEVFEGPTSMFLKVQCLLLQSGQQCIHRRLSWRSTNEISKSIIFVAD